MSKISEFFITDFGAMVNSEELQTKRIQACIDACRDNGGGEVIIPAGTFLTGSIRLYSNMTLRLQSGAILLGSKDYKDYENYHIPTTIQYLYNENYIKNWNLPSYYFYAIITAFKEENISIIGEPGSVIDGQDTFDPNGEEKFRGPMGIIMSQVENLTLSGYVFQNSANWSHELDGCTNIAIDNVIIKAGHDGINLHHSKDITVSDCRIESGDDCFAGYDVENLKVSHCYLNTACNSMRIGGTNLVFDQCIFSGPGRYPHLSKDTYYTHAIFKYYAMSADTIKEDATGIVLKNCSINSADKLLSYDNGKEELLQNNRPLRDFILENVNVSGIEKTSVFKGNGEPATLNFKNVRIDFRHEYAFLEIDKSISLNFEETWFNQPTIIKIDDNTEITFCGKINFKLSR